MTKSVDLHPLVVDLDGTLLRSDLLVESFLGALGLGKLFSASFLREARRGRAALKGYLAEQVVLDYETLPYDASILDLIAEAKAQGRGVYLATASHHSHARAIASHLGVFDGVFASSDTINLKGEAKARALVEAFGEKGFDYIGNSRDDFPVWSHAQRAYSIRLRSGLSRRLTSVSSDAVHLPSPAANWRVWAKALRVHQYAKNLLLFVPLFTAHAFGLATLAQTLLGVAAFSLCASSVYLLNDLMDLRADRLHLTKRNRPFASGGLPVVVGGWLIPSLFVAGCALALLVSFDFLLVMLGYFALTTAYTFWLKSRLILDVVTLALLYTIRIVAGGVAADIAVSEWLLIFSMFVFTSLALMKRYVELATLLEKDLPDPQNRDYRRGDLSIVAALAAASALNSVTIFALYLSSAPIVAAYTRPWALWMICPILLYWLGRALMMAHRREMDDDPVVFALRDRVSQIAIAAMIALVLFAI